MGKFMHTVAYRCNMGGINAHIKRFNELVNEHLKQLQGRGAKIIDVRLQINNDPPPASSAGTITALIIYEADAPLEIKPESGS